MKSTIVASLMFVIFSSAYAEDFYQVSNAKTDVATAPYITSSSYRLLWKANGTNGSVSGLSDYYVKIAAGTTVSYLGLYVSGSGGQFNNMVTVFENGAVMNLTAANEISFNSPSNAMLIYKFRADANATGTVNLSNAAGANFDLSYTGTGANALDRGVDIGSGITMNTLYGLTVANTATTYRIPIFVVSGILNVGTGNSAGNLTVNYAAATVSGSIKAGTSDLTTGGGTYTLNHGSLSVSSGGSVIAGTSLVANVATVALDSGSTLTVGTSVIANSGTVLTVNSGAALNADLIQLNASSLVANGTFATTTSGGTQTVEIKGGSATLSSNATALISSALRMTTANTTLNISGSATVGSFTSTSSTALLSADAGNTFTVGNGTLTGTIFTNSGTASIKGALILNTKSLQGHGTCTDLGKMTVDGGSITENSTSSTYALSAASYSSVVTLKNGASATVTDSSSYLGIGNGTYNVDATSTISTNGIVFYLSGGHLNLSSSSNLVKTAAVLVKDVSTAATISLTDVGTPYVFGNFAFLRISNISFDLNGAELRIGTLSMYNTTATTSIMTFYDFAAGLVKIEGLTTEMISGGTFSIGVNGSMTFVAYGVDGNPLEGTWSIDDNGYLFNSALVPEPAEWAAIFGAIAIGLALYHRKK